MKMNKIIGLTLFLVLIPTACSTSFNMTSTNFNLTTNNTYAFQNSTGGNVTVEQEDRYLLVYPYNQDLIVILLSIISFCLLFIVIYILYKEVMR